MLGDKDSQVSFMYNSSPEPFVPEEHPLRRIGPLIDAQAIRRECAPLYSKLRRPSIPPEQLFLALLAGYIMGIRSERRLVMELQCNMALRWFVGLLMHEKVWDASTFSQNRRRRFGLRAKSVGADKGFFHARFIQGLLRRGAAPHIAPAKWGRQLWHRRVRMRVRGQAYRVSQRCRKKIEELYGEGKEWDGLRRFRRRGHFRVHQEALFIGWVLNLKRLARLLVPLPQATWGRCRYGAGGAATGGRAGQPTRTWLSNHAAVHENEAFKGCFVSSLLTLHAGDGATPC
jgi:hypothetical protein